MKQKLTDKQLIELISSIQTIIGAVNVAQLEFYQLIPDYQQKLGQIKQRTRKVIEDLDAVKKLAYTIVKPKEEIEHIDYGLGHELHRLFVFFSTMEVNQLREFNNLIYQHPTIDIHDLAEKI